MKHRYMSTGDVAARLGIDRSNVVRLIQRGTLQAQFLGGRYVIERDWVERLEQDEAYQRRSRKGVSGR